MRNLILFMLFPLLSVSAQTVADSQRDAIAKYPTLAQQGSPLHSEFIALYNNAKTNSPKLLANPNWPMILAQQAADALEAPPATPPKPSVTAESQPEPKTQDPKPRQLPATAAASNAGDLTQPRAPFDVEMQDTEAFFKDFYDKGHPKPRDQFETEQEYQARLPKPPELDRIYYFVVDHEPAFTYDINTEQLTVVGGEFSSEHFKSYYKYELNGMLPFIFHTKREDKGTYEGSNAYGKSATITKAYFHHCLFHFAPKSLNSRLITKDKSEYLPTQRLALTFPLPRDEAKEVASHIEPVCGVRVLDPKRSAYECISSSKPTIDRPFELGTFWTGIDAQLISLHVLDTRTKQELARFTQ